MFGQVLYAFHVQYPHVWLLHILPVHALVLNVQQVTFQTELAGVTYALHTSQIVWNAHHKVYVHYVMQQINFM